MLTEDQLFASRYRLVKRLGQGAFSEVWKAEDTKAGNLTVALKVYAPDKGLDEDGAKVFSDEFAIVFNVHHSNLLTPNYFDEENNSPYLVLPFCEQGSALKLVSKMDERQVAQFLHDVASALAYLHESEIVHQDIKPDNVLIDAKGNFLVTDFGISTRIRSTLRKSVGDKKSSGTMAYMGPERFSKTPHAIKASDVWSLGATVYELMTGDVPFGDMGGGMQMAGALVPDIPGDYSPSLKQLVELCLSKDTWDRPTAAQLRDICDDYLRTRTWDLSSLDKCGTKEPERQKAPIGRPTERKVRTEFPKDTVKQNKEKPAKFQVAMPKMNKKRWIIILSVIVGFWIVSATTLGMVKRAKTTAEAKERQRLEEEIVKRKSEMQSLAKTYTVDGTSFSVKYVEVEELSEKYMPVSCFCIGETEVTQGLWEAVMGTTLFQQYKKESFPEPLTCVGPNYPMCYVNYYEAVEFCQRINELLGNQLSPNYIFTLPTKDEWNYAARGGKKSMGFRYSGGDVLDNVAWADGCWDLKNAIHPVKRKQPNELGIYDMTGNVHEWCDYEINEDTAHLCRALCGGSWCTAEDFCELPSSIADSVHNRSATVGLRLVLVYQPEHPLPQIPKRSTNKQSN